MELRGIIGIILESDGIKGIVFGIRESLAESEESEDSRFRI